MTTRNFRFALYTALLAFAPAFSSLQALNIFSRARRLYQQTKQRIFPKTGNGLQYGKKDEHGKNLENTTNFDLVRIVKLKQSSVQTPQEYLSTFFDAGATDKPDLWRFTEKDPTPDGYALIVIQFSNDGDTQGQAMIANYPNDVTVVDGNFNKLSDTEQNRIKNLLPFSEEQMQRIRCFAPDKNYVKIHPDKEEQISKHPSKRNVYFTTGGVAMGGSEDALQFMANANLFFGRPIFKDGDEELILNWRDLYRDTLHLATDGLVINPFTLGLERYMMKTYTIGQVSAELSAAFANELHELFHNDYEKTYYGYQIYGKIYESNKGNFEAIARELHNTKDEAKRLKDNKAKSDNWWAQALSPRNMFRITKYVAITFVILLAVYKLLGSALDAFIKWVAPDLKLVGASAYSMETNKLVNLADWFGFTTGRFVRFVLGGIGLWKPKKLPKLGRIFYPTKLAEKEVKNHKEGVEEAVTSNKEAVANGENPRDNVKNLMIWGPAGTGKSETLKRLLEELRIGGFIEYSVYKLTDLLSRKNAAEVAELLERIKELAEQARKNGKAFILVLNEIDALGTRSTENFSEVRNVILNFILQTFDEVGGRWFAIWGTSNFSPKNPEKFDSAFARRFDEIYFGYPNQDNLVKIFMDKLKLHAEGRLKIVDKAAIKRYVASSPYIEEIEGLTGSDMNTLAMDIVSKKRHKLRRKRKDKKTGKGSLFVADVKAVFKTAYKVYTEKYEVGNEDDEEEQKA